MRLINCKINLILIWSANCVITDAVIQATTFATADIKLYQIKIIQNYCNIGNQVLKEQLTAISIN